MGIVSMILISDGNSGYVALVLLMFCNGVRMLLRDSLYDILQESLVKGAREPRRLLEYSWLARKKRVNFSQKL